MKSLTPSYLLFVFFIFNFLFCTSCSKDSDLFNEYVLLDEETEPIENADSDATEESNEEDGSEAKEGDGSGNILINSTFDEVGLWDLENGGTISGGVMTLYSNGGTSVRYSNILNELYYHTRRFRFTFDLRRTSGSGDIQFRQSNALVSTISPTNSFVEYVFEADGNAANSENDINFRGITSGDIFEVDNFKMEIIGDTSNPNVPGLPAQVTFFTDFEFSTYGYDQWGVTSQQPSELNQWEVDQDTPRTTAHPDSPLKSGRDGTGEAVWLGTYNNPDGYNFDRNQLIRDAPTDWGEHWVGFSMYVQNPLGENRIIFQPSQLSGTSNRVNTISLRQGDGQLYFSLSDQSAFVNQTKNNLGYWNGAGTNTTSYFFDYNDREWIDVVIHYKGGFGAGYTGPETSTLQNNLGFDPVRDGFVKIWINGTQIVDITGTTTYRYTKEGHEYRGGISQVIATYWGGPINFAKGGDVYYDNFKIWVGPDGTFSNVDPSN